MRLALASLVLLACASAAPPPPPPWVAAYSAELAACASTAPTRDASHACRADVEARYASRLDGGAK